MKLPVLPLLHDLCRGVISATIPAVRLNQDRRRAAALCQKWAGFGCGVVDECTVENHEMRSSRNREKKYDAQPTEIGDNDAPGFYVNDGQVMGKSYSRFNLVD